MANIYNYFKKASLKISNLAKEPLTFTYLLAVILLAIPLKYIFGSIASIVFLVACCATLGRAKFTFNKALLLPILFYGIMLLSLFWTKDQPASISGLQKELLFLSMPLCFLFIPILSKIDNQKVFRIFSFGMAGYAVYYFSKAAFAYLQTGNKNVFFYHELVTLDLNAIYVSVFASFGLFYFIAIHKRTTIENTAVLILSVFIFLLSSKSIIFIDLLLVICFYTFFSDTQKGVKALTILSISAFLLFSIVFVKQIRERFLLEYETAFVDNTLNEDFVNGEVYNMSLSQAWNNEKFQQNHFLPGTALRVYQLRIFIEMFQQQNILFTGFGLEASQDQIRKKSNEHGLYPGYGDFNFHNQYLQTFAELGLFGFLTLIAMLFFNIKKAICDENFLHIVFSLMMIVLFLTESFFCRQRGIVFFITLYCMFNVIQKPRKGLKQI